MIAKAIDPAFLFSVKDDRMAQRPEGKQGKGDFKAAREIRRRAVEYYIDYVERAAAILQRMFEEANKKGGEG